MAALNRTDGPRSNPSYGISIVSVAMVLFLLGFFGLVLLQAQRLVTLLKEEINLIVEVRDEAGDEEVATLREYLESSSLIKPGSMEFISKEQGIELLKQDFGEDFLEAGLPNPLFDVFTFNVQSQYMNPDSLASIRTRLKAQWPAVSDVYYQKGMIETLSRNLRKMGWFALGISVLFLLVAFVLIHNTIRLALYSNRFLIKTQELVGASWEFISRPFLRRSVWNGILSALLGIAGLNAMLWLIQQQIPELKNLQDLTGILGVFGFLVLAGILITFSSTYYVINKYLKMRVDDMY